MLAHELTHAIDDQHFDLDRLDDMVIRCEDEPFQAALGIVEGSANHFATQVLIRFGVSETGSIPDGGPAGEVPPFITEFQAYPYTIGQRFADALSDADGPRAIDDALETFPTTTEQVMHPEKFPDEAGEAVDVPDFAPTFGPEWRDIDAMVVGELWLKVLLHLRLDDDAAAAAAAGWGGATYRAWSDGEDVAVVMSTVWDTPKDAQEFSSGAGAVAVSRLIAGARPRRRRHDGARGVRVRRVPDGRRVVDPAVAVMRRAMIALALTLVLAACGGESTSPSRSPSSSSSPSSEPSSGGADVGGYELSYECSGEGAPTVILEAGLGAAGTEEFFGFIDQVAAITRVCTYDRAGTGTSDDRPDGLHVTAGLMAEELHRLLEAIGVTEPVVLVGHSYGGMPVRAFEGTYPSDVAGMVLIDVSSEPEVPVYERLDAGPWIDGTDRIDIHATVRELHAAGDLGDIPLVVVTAGIIEDEWLATVPELAARAQARLAGLSSNGYEVVAPDSGHFVHRDAPDVVLAAIEAVVAAAGSGEALTPCEDAFASTDATCVPAGTVPHLVSA